MQPRCSCLLSLRCSLPPAPDSYQSRGGGAGQRCAPIPLLRVLAPARLPSMRHFEALAGRFADSRQKVSHRKPSDRFDASWTAGKRSTKLASPAMCSVHTAEPRGLYGEPGGPPELLVPSMRKPSELHGAPPSIRRPERLL